MNESVNDKPDSGPLGQVEVEWQPLDHLTRLKSVAGHDVGEEEGESALKARCRECWGEVEGRFDDFTRAPDSIRCRVCGKTLEGDAAKEEYQRMSDEDGSNMFSMAFDLGLKYREDAIFVRKWFPYIERQREVEFLERVAKSASDGIKKGWLTRSGFPAGSAGFLLLQARTLMAGIERLPRDMSVARPTNFKRNDDGSVTVYLSKEELAEHPRTQEYGLLKRLGSTMTIAMVSAFACELAMKAICLTRMDEARKSHDLWRLYRDLPSDCQKRFERDWPEIRSVLKRVRYTFDKWRYFEANVGGYGLSAMIDTERAFALSKAARVIFDEGELAGLGYSVDVKVTHNYREMGDKTDVHIKHSLDTEGREAPPK